MSDISQSLTLGRGTGGCNRDSFLHSPHSEELGSAKKKQNPKKQKVRLLKKAWSRGTVKCTAY